MAAPPARRNASNCGQRGTSRSLPRTGRSPRLDGRFAITVTLGRDVQALDGFKKITAPFDAVATARETDIGALITALHFADIHKTRTYVDATQQLSADIRVGLTA